MDICPTRRPVDVNEVAYLTGKQVFHCWNLINMESHQEESCFNKPQEILNGGIHESRRTEACYMELQRRTIKGIYESSCEETCYEKLQKRPSQDNYESHCTEDSYEKLQERPKDIYENCYKKTVMRNLREDFMNACVQATRKIQATRTCR